MSMVDLVNGRTGQSVTKVAAMVTNIEKEIVTIQYHEVMVRIVHGLGHSQKEDRAKSKNAQWTVVGVATGHMEHARNHVKVEFSIVIEHAQIRHQLMVENAVLGKQLKQEHAIYKTVL